MNPEEKHILQRSLKLAEENNEILRRVDARAKRAAVYGFVKLAIIILPFVVGYFLLEPYFDQVSGTYNELKQLMSR